MKLLGQTTQEARGAGGYGPGYLSEAEFVRRFTSVVLPPTAST